MVRNISYACHISCSDPLFIILILSNPSRAPREVPVCLNIKLFLFLIEPLYRAAKIIFFSIVQTMLYPQVVEIQLAKPYWKSPAGAFGSVNYIYKTNNVSCSCPYLLRGHQ